MKLIVSSFSVRSLHTCGLDTRLSRGFSSRSNVGTGNNMNGMRVVKGRASAVGTKQFLTDRKVPLSHAFNRSAVFVNPIIHGPPKATAMSKEEADRNIVKAIMHNHSNAVFVYDHRDQEEGGPWYSNVLVPLINEHRAVSRDQLVVMAALGDVENADDVDQRLQEARQLSEVGHIDIAVMKVCVSF